MPEIRKSPGDWQLIEVSLTPETSFNIPFIARKLGDHFATREGIAFICNRRQILAVVRMGPASDIQKLSSDISSALPKLSCTVDASEITADGLLKFQIRLQTFEEEARGQSDHSALLEMRQRRVERVVMVADDDMFMRSLVANTFKGKCKIIELGDVTTLVDSYLEHLPDVLFLDIHLPGGSGIDALGEILKFDNSAYIVILSSDSVKENVLSAKKLGARGFIAKPFTRQKLEECYNQSPSVAPWVAPKK